jgi:hypothetical protein
MNPRQPQLPQSGQCPPDPGSRPHRSRRRQRAAALALAVASLVTAELTLGQAPANAGTVGVTGRIQGAGSIIPVDGGGGPYSCFADWNQNDRNTVTCPRQPFEAVFEAWVWLEARPASTPAGNWRFDHWEGCNTTQTVGGTVRCAVHSGAFDRVETSPKAVFDDFVAPTITGVTPTQSAFNDREFSFSFGSNDPGASAACAMDSQQLQPCVSGYTRTLSEGVHTMSVRATDTSGNNGPTLTETVVALDTALTSGPTGSTNSRDATFGFSTIGGSNFDCALDFAPFTPCGNGLSQSKSYAGLGDGTHTFRVRAVNGRWADQLPASRSWTIDSTPPGTTLTDANINGGSATFTFDGSGGHSSFECQLDGPSQAHGWRACGSPASYVDLPDGSYQFQVRARDTAGNVDLTPESRTWNVDTTGPETTITSGPVNNGWSLRATQTLGYASSEATSTFRCTFDGAARTCVAPSFTGTGITPGTHRFTVAARDTGGNEDATPAQRTWTLPMDDIVLAHGPGWQLRSSADAYLGTYSQATRRGATLSKRVAGARKIALVASRGPGHGTVNVYAGSRLLRTVRLAAPTLLTKQVVPITNFATPTNASIRIMVTSRGKPVRIEGFGVAN